MSPQVSRRPFSDGLPTSKHHLGQPTHRRALGSTCRTAQSQDSGISTHAGALCHAWRGGDENLRRGLHITCVHENGNEPETSHHSLPVDIRRRGADAPERQGMMPREIGAGITRKSAAEGRLLMSNSVLMQVAMRARRVATAPTGIRTRGRRAAKQSTLNGLTARSPQKRTSEGMSGPEWVRGVVRFWGRGGRIGTR